MIPSYELRGHFSSGSEVYWAF